MRQSPSTLRREAERERRVAEALRVEWRLFERVTVSQRPDGDGFEATIHLNATLVRGAAEQQSLRPSPATAAKLAAQRLDAISACVDRVNERLPRADSIQHFVVLGLERVGVPKPSVAAWAPQRQ